MSIHPQPHASSGYNPYAPPIAGAELGEPRLGYGLEDHILAGRGTRFGAFIVDNIFLAFGAALPGIIILAAMFPSDDGMIIGAIIAFAGLLALVIYQWYLISTTGQSLAKRWLGIRIIKIDGMPCGFVHGVVLRSWVMTFIAQIPIVGTICGLVDPLLIFGDERRCLHDVIASTKVVIASD